MSKSFTVKYEGKWPSTNTLRNGHWRSNQGLKVKMRKIYADLILEQQPKPMDQFVVKVCFNSRLDVDNVSMKFFMDSMKDIGIIVDDNRKHFRGLTVVPDETLDKSTYVITVTEV